MNLLLKKNLSNLKTHKNKIKNLEVYNKVKLDVIFFYGNEEK